MVPVLAAKVGCSEGYYSRDVTGLVPLPTRSSLSKAGTDIPSLPEPAAWFYSTADQEWVAWPRQEQVSHDETLGELSDQQRVALPRENTLELLVKPLGV